jgi:two-component system, NarL family, sensor kinase
MYKTSIFFIALIASVHSFAQNKILDSLIKLTYSQKDSLLCNTYNELTWQFRNVDRTKAIAYGNKALELANKLGYKKSVAQAYNDLGIIYYDKENYDTAILLYNNAIAIRKEMKDDLGIAKLYNKIGIVYQRQGVFDKALEFQYASLKLFEKEKNDYGTSYAQNNIGILNQNLGRYKEAIEYYNKSIAIKEKINDQIGVAGTLSNIANIYFLTKEYTKAEVAFNKSIAIAREIQDKEYLANALNNLGKLYIANKQYNKALEKINESLQLREALSDTKGIVSCLNNLGDIYVDLKEFNKADSLYNKGLLLGKKAVNCMPEVNDIYLALSNLYEMQGDNAKALTYFKLYNTTKDSLYTDKVGQTFAELETKYKTLEKEKQIKEQQFQITKKNYWIISIAVAVALMSLIVYLLYRRYKHKQQSKLQQEIMHQQQLATQAVLMAEENERQRIAIDLHDGIGQTMSAAKMNISALQNEFHNLNLSQKQAFEKVISLVDESCKEVRAVSHSMMPNALLKNGLTNAIRAFIHQIDNKVIKIDVHTEGLQEKLNSNVETVLYRVVQECVNNVIKHSGANHLDIALIKDADGLSVTIEDNGKGFDTNDKSKLEGIGIKNILSRIQYLNGTVEWQSQTNKGTLVAIHLPA